MTNKICESVYLVGGSELSDPRDCQVYLVDFGSLILVDCGAGPGWARIEENIRKAGYHPERIQTLILTHSHIDHIGAAHRVKDKSNCSIVAHQLDTPAIESGDSKRTAADWYGIPLEGIPIDHEMTGDSETLEFSMGTIILLHTPGHTPGSIVAVADTPDDHRVLFGQDIHGPFSQAFDSDIDAWRRSMRDLIALDADILCEGHFGVFHGQKSVHEFIEEQLASHP